jgi:6-pyruvoyltetrahydropterin/6-carboxytetrahydropterin synthase
MEAYLTVSTNFSAAHRLAHPQLSYDQNCEIYGKCARPNGHGHNYHIIAIYIRQLLQSPIQKLGAKLHKVKLIESPNNSCEVYCTGEISSVEPDAIASPVLTFV